MPRLADFEKVWLNAVVDIHSSVRKEVWWSILKGCWMSRRVRRGNPLRRRRGIVGCCAYCKEIKGSMG